VRALVTGGAGFIGSTLVDRLLAEGHAVDVVDDLSTGALANLAEARADRSHELKIHQLDAADPAVVDLAVRRSSEVVFHLAGSHDRAGSVDDPVEATTALVAGALRAVDAARAAGARKIVVVVGGSDLYGEPDPADLPLREGAPRRPDSPLGVATGAVVDLLAVSRDLHQIEHTVLALPTVYGPRQRPERTTGVVAALVAEMLAGRPGTVHGDGSQTRDLLYVDDAVDGLVRAAERGSGLVCNLGTGSPTSVAELRAAVAAAVGLDGVPEATAAPPRRHDRRHLSLDRGRARIHLGWQPWTSLEAGLAEVVAWFRSQG
jgi:UDP-glucose 4-epimerase